MVLDQAEIVAASAQLGRVFTPSGPVQTLDMLAGRLDEITRIIGAVGDPGKHVVIYGDRGVGKTSVARFIHEVWEQAKEEHDLVAVHISADGDDGYLSLMYNIGEAIDTEYEKREIPRPRSNAWVQASQAIVDGQATAHATRRFFEIADRKFVIVIDEFDRIEDPSASTAFADSLKTLSDHHVDATFVLVGVADTIDDLMSEHASITRSLEQVHLPYMRADEIRDIIKRGLRQLGMSADADVPHFVAKLAQGVPYYAHVFGLYSCRAALGDQRMNVTKDDVWSAIRPAVRSTEESVRSAYTTATRSPRKENLFSPVLLACALAKTDELGWFPASAVREPLRVVAKRPTIEIGHYANHLSKFASEGRGDVLRSAGEPYRRRYRFANALLRPFAILRGVEGGVITEDTLDAFLVDGTMDAQAELWPE